MFEHYIHCYKLFEEDKKYLKHVYELRYEDYVEDPDKYHQEIATFIGTRIAEPPKEDSFRVVLQQWNRFGLRVPECTMEIPSAAYNQKYFDFWSYCLKKSPFKTYYRYIAKKYEPEFARYGYSLIKRFIENGPALKRGSKIDALCGPVCCLGADAGALLRRCAVRTRHYAKRAVKKCLPTFVINKVRQTRESALLRQERA